MSDAIAVAVASAVAFWLWLSFPAEPAAVAVAPPALSDVCGTCFIEANRGLYR